MGETLGPDESELGLTESESRFGDKELLVEIMEKGSVKNLGNVENHYEIGSHRNKVELVRVEDDSYRTKDIKFVTLEEDGKGVAECIFKPLNGEDKKFNEANGLGNCYPREAASYLVSEHFDLDIVPPTIIREIEGEVGSLQIFMPQSEYVLGKQVMESIEGKEFDDLKESSDMKKLIILDWIIANADRHSSNYLIKAGENGHIHASDSGQEIIAIDNGAAFNERFYRYYTHQGPYNFLTYDNAANKISNTQIPNDLLDRVRAGRDKQNVLHEALLSLPDIESEEITKMWQRVERLLEAGVFMSPHNFSQR